MKLHDRQVDLLAERYVIGVQRGAARRRFLKLAKARRDIRESIHRVEERLTPLAWRIEPIQPSELVWHRICREVGITPSRREQPRRTMAPWAAAAALATVAIISSLGWWHAATRPPEVVTETVVERIPEDVAVAVINRADGTPLWLTRIAPVSAELLVRVVNDVERQPDKDYQLWALTDAGVPVSLGLLPQAGERVLALQPEALTALAGSSALAVSLEPSGGSPEPTPTGPVLYTAILLAP